MEHQIKKISKSAGIWLMILGIVLTSVYVLSMIGSIVSPNIETILLDICLMLPSIFLIIAGKKLINYSQSNIAIQLESFAVYFRLYFITFISLILIGIGIIFYTILAPINESNYTPSYYNAPISEDTLKYDGKNINPY